MTYVIFYILSLLYLYNRLTNGISTLDGVCAWFQQQPLLNKADIETTQHQAYHQHNSTL